MKVFIHKRKTKAQSILEYVIILTVILAAVIIGTKYIKKSLVGEGDEVSESSLFGEAGSVITDFTGELPGVKEAESPDG